MIRVATKHLRLRVQWGIGGCLGGSGSWPRGLICFLMLQGSAPACCPPDLGGGEERMEERVRLCWDASWWGVTLAPKDHRAATLTPKCYPTAPDLSMLLLLVLLFQEVAAPSTLAWSHQAVIWNSKIPFGWTSHSRIRQGLFSLSCTVTQHFPGSYLQRSSSQLLRISAAQSAPDCTSHCSLPCCHYGTLRGADVYHPCAGTGDAGRKGCQ